MDLISDFNFWQEFGVLPSAGGLREQPARFVEALPILRQTVIDVARDLDALRGAAA
jgi:hypothetical protein